jgi:hypothetical protein
VCHPEPGLDALRKGEIYCYCRESYQEFWFVQAVTQSLYSAIFVVLTALAVKNTTFSDVTCLSGRNVGLPTYLG